MHRNTVQVLVANRETLARARLGPRFSSMSLLRFTAILTSQKWLAYKIHTNCAGLNSRYVWEWRLQMHYQSK